MGLEICPNADGASWGDKAKAITHSNCHTIGVWCFRSNPVFPGLCGRLMASFSQAEGVSGFSGRNHWNGLIDRTVLEQVGDRSDYS